MKNKQSIYFLFLNTCCFSLGCDMPPNMMNPDADTMPTPSPTPTPTPTPAPLPDPATGEVAPYCVMKTLDPALLVEKIGSGEQITDIRVAANDKGFAIAWRNNLSALPTMFRSFDWNHKPTSDVVHLGDMYLGWPGLVGGSDDYLTVETKFVIGTEIPPEPFKYTFRRVSASGELSGMEWPQLQHGERETAPHVMFDGKYYRVTAMIKRPVGCRTFFASWQVNVTGLLIQDGSRCIDLGGDDPVNMSIRSVLPMGDDVLIAYDHHPGGTALFGSIKIVGLRGTIDWTPVTVPASAASFTLLLGVYNTPFGTKMLWLKGGEGFVSSLDEGKITTSYTFGAPLSAPIIDGDSIYGLNFDRLDETTEFKRNDLKGNPTSKIDLKSSATDRFYSVANRNGKFVIAGFSYWSGSTKKPELRTISCQ